MKYLTPSACLFALLVLTAGTIRGQDSELGLLPEPPNLDLGYPDRKQSWRERRQSTRMEEARREESADQRQSEDASRANTASRLATSTSERPKKLPLSPDFTRRSSLPSADDGITPSGSRLQAFGDAGYWDAMPLPTPDESLIVLPPAPDLRTPDQVSKRERARELQVAKQARSKAEADAVREQKEALARAVVNRPAPDPSTALVQVQSRRAGEVSYEGNREAPPTLSEGTLKPFSDTSSYYKDDKLVYRGNKIAGSAGKWSKRRTGDQVGE